MAWEIPLFKPSGFKSTNDLSSNQFKCVKLDTANDNSVVSCSVTGEKAFGILQNKPKAGQEAEVMLAGITKAVVNGSTAVVRGDKWGVNSDGTIVTVVTQDTGKDLNKFWCGEVLESGAAGTTVAVTIGLGSGVTS